jgi:hypothetical protein
MKTPALLVLEDGRSFRGESFGAEGETFGEAVFATGMTGYQETLTDPSYHRQVVVMTAPHIGNTGLNDEDPESQRIWVAGYVVREPARVASNWRSRRPLDESLRDQGVVGISGIDTRALTRHLRERGAMRVGISSVARDPSALLERALGAPAGGDARRVAHDVPGDPDAGGLGVLVVDAGVADVRGCHHDDLPVVRRVGERLLVARRPGGEHRLTEGLAGGAVGLTAERPAVLQHQHRWWVRDADARQRHAVPPSPPHGTDR